MHTFQHQWPVPMCLHVLGAWEGAYFWAFVGHLYAHIPTPVACTYVFIHIRSMGRGIFRHTFATLIFSGP